MSILVTGGAGFIGSHTCVELLNAGYDVVVVDNLYNASPKALDRVKEITGKDLKFYEADIRDREALNEVFDKEEVELFLEENAELKYYQVVCLAKLMHMKCDEFVISEN